MAVATEINGAAFPGSVEKNETPTATESASNEGAAAAAAAEVDKNAPSPFLPGGRKRMHKIHAPQTRGDFGAPSDSVVKDAKRIFLLIQDERHLTAHALYVDVKRRLQEMEEHVKLQAATSSPTKGGGRHPHLPGFHRHHHHKNQNNHHHQHDREEKELNHVRKVFEARQAELAKLDGRVRLFKRAKGAFDDVSGDWILAQTFMGITTYYRREKNGSLSIRVEGEMEGLPLFEQVCVLREIDLNQTWAPFCSSSLLIAELDKLDCVGWYLIGLPNFGLARDACFRAIGCDCMMEDGEIILVGQGIKDIPKGGEPPEDTFLSDDPILDTLDIPPVPNRLGSGRMTMRHFDAIIRVTSPTSCSMKLISNIDPNMAFVPQSLLDFVMKKLCGVVLHKLTGAARKIIRNPVNNPHAIRMRSDGEFYQRWLLPKCEAACEHLGWEMPPVGALQVSDENLAGGYGGGELAVLSKGMGSYSEMNHHTPIDSNRSAMTAPIGGYHGGPRYHDGHHGHASLQHGFDRGGDNDSLADLDSISEISDLSGTTWSVWRHNPITSYMREMEQRTQKRKAAAIEIARREAEDRLKPKEFDLYQKKRLEELRKRKAESKQPSGATSVCSTNSTYSQPMHHHPYGNINGTGGPGGAGPSSISDTTSFVSAKSAAATTTAAGAAATLTTEDPYKTVRLFCMACLTFLLFSMLYFDTNMEHFSLLQEDNYVAGSDESRKEVAATAKPFAKFVGLLIVKGFGTMVYIISCGIVHFALCDITLIYAFHSTELGLKSGHQIKNFYSTKIRLLVAAFSGLLVCVSIGKAMLLVGLRGLVWSITSFATWLVQTVLMTWIPNMFSRLVPLSSSSSATSTSLSLSMSNVPYWDSVLVPFWDSMIYPTILPIWNSAVDFITQSMAYLHQCFVTYIINSNFLGRSIGIITGVYYNIFASLVKNVNDFFASTDIAGGDDNGTAFSLTTNAATTTWRFDAFMTCRYLLSHSAIFLLVSVFLFNIFVASKNSLIPTTEPQEEKAEQNKTQQLTQEEKQHNKSDKPEMMDPSRRGEKKAAAIGFRDITPIREEESLRRISFIQRNNPGGNNNSSNRSEENNPSLGSPGTTASSTPRPENYDDNEVDDNQKKKNRKLFSRMMKKGRRKKQKRLGRGESDAASAAADYYSNNNGGGNQSTNAGSATKKERFKLKRRSSN